ncbi:MAG: hypothetical protein R3245_04215, partial [Kiloniellales bacterium]|nr:hypothetical protein [Kiloniellales bacterium]
RAAICAMKLIDQGIYFERQGEGFVYRPTIFSKGFSISAAEKEQLLAGFKQLERRFLIEGLGLIAVIALVFMTGLIATPTPIPWFLLLSVGAVLALAPLAIYRKRRLVEAVLGRPEPDVPRQPIRQALTRPRPLLAKGPAITIMRSVVVLLIVATIVIDVFAFIPLVVGLLPPDVLGQTADNKAIADALAHTLYSVPYWAGVAGVNACLLLSIWLLMGELRRIRAYFESKEPDEGRN